LVRLQAMWLQAMRVLAMWLWPLAPGLVEPVQAEAVQA